MSCYTTKSSISGNLGHCTFTGKERDEETGYGYFGARYMDHELMTMWLSVDPLADKYPSISPYAYCAWNPIKLVDPDGRDVWELNKSGELIWKEASETDIIKASDGSFVEVAEGVLFRSQDGKHGRNYTKTDNHYGISFNTNENNAFEVFEFLADHSEVEFSLFEVREKDNSSSFMLTTSFQETGDSWGSQQAQVYLNNGQLSTHIHSHPSGSLQQSFNKDVPSFIGTQVNAYVYCPMGKNIAFEFGGYKRYHSSSDTNNTPKFSSSKMTVNENEKRYKYYQK